MSVVRSWFPERQGRGEVLPLGSGHWTVFGLLALFWAWPPRLDERTSKLISSRDHDLSEGVKVCGLLGQGVEKILLHLPRDNEAQVSVQPGSFLLAMIYGTRAFLMLAIYI